MSGELHLGNMSRGNVLHSSAAVTRPICVIGRQDGHPTTIASLFHQSPISHWVIARPRMNGCLVGWLYWPTSDNFVSSPTAIDFHFSR